MSYFNEPLVKSIELGGRQLKVETGKLANQANGSAVVSYGDTMVLVTATASKEPREGIDFFPLTVDYEERLYAVGKIPGGFMKREGRPSEKAVLSSRLIDRPIRPLFPKGYKNDVHIVATVLSVDQDSSPDVVAMVGASFALTLSDIPFQGPIGAVTVGLVGGEYVINPTVEQAAESELNLTIAGTADAVLMVEAGAQELSEEVILEAIMFGHEEIKRIVSFQDEYRTQALEVNLAKEKAEAVVDAVNEELEERVKAVANDKIKDAIVYCAENKVKKQARDEHITGVKKELVQELAEEFPEQEKDIKSIIGKLEKENMRKMTLEQKMRVDGRAHDEVRPIRCEVGITPRTHGSGLFTRGETQILTVATLGAIGEEQIVDGLGIEESKRYMHYYNFPPFSVGEARPMRGPGRREIGHGILAERALEPMIPSEEDFPYTLRLVSEALGSNGSTSMGSVCGSTLSLMDAGVPIKAPVSGVAMGLIQEGDQIAILTDIQGVEDALGDMDFKVAGTKKGITAIQMDIKIDGLSRELLQRALEQAKAGRMHILGEMLKVIAEPKSDLSQYAPRIMSMYINPDKIRDVIGPGGKTIKKLVDETGVKIDIEDDGKVYIAAADVEAGNKALKMIEDLVVDVEVGKLYMGKVMRIMNFGAFVEVLPGKEGLVHISQLAEDRVEKVEDVVKVGDEILVKVTEIDKQGRVNLSRKAAMREQEKNNTEKSHN
ncbi:polyribonucleotide nucleotidyltransferase [Desulfitispora alkaliphila]|uniref:polyribonucleotide nucleotidyltransferase n=1 Tax=Desulfitispora alkaliphila TaxID=622674 RepID=UPI003D247FC5